MMSETTGRRIRRSESEWQQLIAEQAQSGLSQVAFCHAKRKGASIELSYQARSYNIPCLASLMPCPLFPLLPAASVGRECSL